MPHSGGPESKVKVPRGHPPFGTSRGGSFLGVPWLVDVTHSSPCLMGPCPLCVCFLSSFLIYFLLVLIFILFIYYFFKNKFIYFWLRWVFVAARGLSLVAASGGYSSLWCAGFSLWWLPLLRSTGSGCAGFSSCGSRAQ